MPVLQQVTAFKLSGFTYDGSSTQFNYTANVTAGAGLASKALVLDTSRNISNINNMELTGTLKLNASSDGSQLVINSVTGDCLKLIYNELNGTATYYSNINVSNTGNLILTSSGNDIIINSTNNLNIVGHNSSTIGLKLNNILVTATANQLNYLSDISTPGIVVANKALVVDTNKDLSSLRNLTLSGVLTTNNLVSTNLSGTLQTAVQPNITSVGTLSSLTVTNNITASTLTGTLQTASQSNITSVGTLSALNISGLLNSTNNIQTTGIYYSGINLTNTVSYQGSWQGLDYWGIGQENANTIRLSKCSQLGVNSGYANLKCANITSTDTITATNLVGSLQTAAQTGITTIGTLTGLNISGIINSTNITSSTTSSIGSVTLSGSIAISNTTDAINISNGGTFTTAGGVSIAKKLYVGSDLNVTGTINGTIQTASQPNITSIGALTGLIVNGSQTITQSSKSLYSALLFNNSGDNSTWEYGLQGTLASNNPGTIYWYKGAFKMILTDTGCLTIGNNIVSQSTYNLSTTSANFTNLYLNGTQINSTSTELNYLSGIILGSTSANKAIVVDSNKDISGIRNLTLTGNLLGLTSLTLPTLILGSTTVLSSGTELNYLNTVIAGNTTASKALVVDANKALSGLGNIRTSGNLGINTNVVGKQLEINSVTGDCLRLTYNNSNGTPTVYCDQVISSTGMVSINANGPNAGFTFNSPINGTLATNSQPNITSLGILTGLNVSGNISGTNSTSSLYFISSRSSSTISNFIGTLSSNYWGLGTEGTTPDTTIRLSLCDITGTNTGYANFKCANITSTGSITGNSNLTINGTLTGVTSLSATTLTLGGTLISATGSQINTLTVSTPGIVNASKALIVDANKALSGLGNISSTGTITTSNGFIHNDGTINFQTSTLSSSFYFGTTTSHALNLTTNGTAQMTILSNGNIGINKSNPDTNIKLDVSGNIRGSILLVGTSADTSSTRLISATDSTLTTSGIRTLCLGKANTNNNQFEIAYVHASGDGSNQNYLKIGATGSTNLFMIRADGNIGIGTLSPSYKLDINGSMRSSNLFLGTSTDTNTNRLISALDSTMVSGDVRYITLGQASSAGNQAEIGYLFNGSGSTSNAMRIGFHSREIIRLTNAGYMGIGTTSPTYTLDVNGNINYTGSLYNNGNSINLLTLSGITAGTASANKALITDSNISISGLWNISSSYYNANNMFKCNSSSSSAHFCGYWNSSNYWGLGPDTITNNSTIRLGISDLNGAWTGTYANLKINRLTTLDYVRIGNTYDINAALVVGDLSSSISQSFGSGAYLAPGGTGYSSGSTTTNLSIYCLTSVAAAGTFYTNSDRRIKKNIEKLSIEDSLNFIKTINPVTYNLKTDKDLTSKQYGYIAQDLKYYSNLLHFMPKENLPKEEDDDIENILLSVDYNKISVLLHNGIKYILDENENLKKKNEDLEIKIEKIETRLAKLEQLLNNSN